MNKHNPIDVDKHSIMVDTPFYKWLKAEQDAGNEVTSLTKACKQYLKFIVGTDKLSEAHYTCYKAIIDTYWWDNSRGIL